MADKPYSVHRIEVLPTVGVDGDWYILKKPNNRHEIYVGAPDGSLVFNKGITDQEQQRLLTDYTNSQIDTKVNEATALATSSLIPVTTTTLPRGANIPSYITSKGKATLRGGDSADVVYSNTGVTATPTITVKAGYERDAFYDKTSDTWSAGLEQKLPTQTGTNVIVPGGQTLVNQDGVYKYSATKEDLENKIQGARTNLFNKNSPDIQLGTNVNPDSGASFPISTTNLSPYIKVEGSTSYTVSSRSHLAWYDANKVYISGINYSSDTSKTFTSPSNAVYVRYGYLTTFDINTMMFVKGTSLPITYIPYSTIYIDGNVKIQESNLPTTIALKGQIAQKDLLFAVSKTGTNLFNKNDADVTVGFYVNSVTGLLASNPSYTASGYIPVLENTDYYFSNKTHIAWYNSNKVFISGSGSSDTNRLQKSPTGAVYLRTSILNSGGGGVNGFYVNKDSNKGFEEYVQYYELQNTKAGIQDNVPDEFLLFIPDFIYVAQGRTIELYFDQISWTGNIDNYHFLVTGVGRSLERKWQITGTSTNQGSYQATCSVYNNNMKIVATKTFTVIISSNIITTPFSVVPIGDSLTNGKFWLTEVRNLSNTNISFTGTRYTGYGSGGVIKHEGRSGVATSYYTGNNSYTFDTNGEQGIDGRTQNLNPLFNPTLNKIDWNYYKSNYNKSPNKIMIWTGTNGLSIDPTIAVANLRTFINGLRTSGADTVPIYIVFTLYRSDQNGIGMQSGTDGYSANSSLKLIEDRKIFNLLLATYTEFKNDVNTYFIPVGLCHDSKYNYGSVPTPVNPRASQTELFPVESIHPQQQGYEQIADVIFSTLCATQS